VHGVQPRSAPGAAKTVEQFFEGRNDRLEILAPEVCPFIVMHHLVNGPLPAAPSRPNFS